MVLILICVVVTSEEKEGAELNLILGNVVIVAQGKYRRRIRVNALLNEGNL